MKFSKYKFKYYCDDWDSPVKASAKSDNLYAYECGLLNLKDAIDEELKRIGSDGKWPDFVADRNNYGEEGE